MVKSVFHASSHQAVVAEGCNTVQVMQFMRTVSFSHEFRHHE